jgi:hypothetical protein
MIPAVETIQAFRSRSRKCPGQALVRTNWHIEKLRKADRMEEAAAIQADLYVEMLATFRHELMQPVNVAWRLPRQPGNPPRRRSGALVAHKAWPPLPWSAKKLSGGSASSNAQFSCAAKSPRTEEACVIRSPPTSASSTQRIFGFRGDGMDGPTSTASECQRVAAGAAQRGRPSMNVEKNRLPIGAVL